MSRIVLRPTFGKAVEVANLPVYAGSTTVTPTQSTQTLNTGNKLVASNITVEPMPAGSAATPTSSITPTVTMSVDNDGKVTATVSGSREITPSVSAGYVTSGTPGTVSVSGAGELQLPKMTSDNMTASGNTVTAPAGFYPSAASRSVISGSATTPATEITPSITISLDSSNGQISAAVSGSKSVTPTVSEGYVTEGIAGTVTVAGTSSTSIPIKTAETFHPSTSDQTISSGKLLTGDQTIKGVTVTNLTAGNIKDGVTVEIGDSTDSDCVTSVTGTYEGESPNLQAKTNIDPTTSSQTITYDSGYDGLSSVQINAMPSGTEGTPTATKGTVSNHSISVTPSVTNSAGYISGGTHSGTAVSVSASELVSGTLTVDSSGTKDVTNYASASIPSGTEGTPTATKGTVSNHSVSVTPSVTNTVGFISGGTHNGTAVSVSASELVSGTLSITSAGTKDVTNYASVSVGSSTATISATKGTVSNHSISVTPSVTRTAGYASAGTSSGVAVTVSASELVSGSETKTSNGTYDVTNLAQLVVNVSGGGGSLSYDTKTVTASNYPTFIEFTGMKGQPKFFVVRLNAQVSSSGSTTYYYIVDIVSNCNGTSAVTHGNCFRIGSTRRVDNITSGYSWSYSGTTLTITSSAASRSASPGAFYSGSYELLYAY